MNSLSKAEVMQLTQFATGTWLPRYKQYGGVQTAAFLVEDTPHQTNGATLSSACSFQTKQRVLWSEEEDNLLRELVSKYGTTKWSLIASKIPFKTNKHCRRRWQACVNATGNKGVWTVEEDAKLLQGHHLFGNRWTEIAKLVPGRTDNAAKNRFMAITKKDGIAVGQASMIVASSACESSVSGNIGDIPTCDSVSGETHSVVSCGNKRMREAVPCTPSSRYKKPFLLDLNIVAPCISSSEDSELVQGGETSAESVHVCSPREWLDLNENPLVFDNCCGV